MILLYHVNMQTGMIGKCSAAARQCPFGNSTVHYVTPAEARAAYEEAMASEAHRPRSKREGFSRGAPSEDLSGPTGYYRALHASGIPGATIKITKRTLLGSHRYRFIQRGDKISNRGWLRICDETKEEKFVSSRDFVKEFFHAKDYKLPNTIELKRGVTMELKLPRLRDVAQWLSEGDEGPMVKRYSDEPQGLLRRREALEAWEKAVSLSQKGVRSPELRNWLLRAYEELDSRDRPPREHLTNLLRPRA